MKAMKISEAARIVHGELFGGDGSECIRSVVIDSRAVTDGSLFAALPGERVDGHDYIPSAFDRGAVCCLATHVPENENRPIIVVEDVRTAIRTLAAEYRKQITIPVIGIAGSVGKTTTKEMVSSVLGAKYKVLKTEKNLNNDLGVPLTLFRIDPEHEAAVVEMGISDFGEMSVLAEMVRPDLAVYTVIGDCHLEQLHDRNGVLQAKTEMVDYLPENGCIIYNGDDAYLSSYDWKRKTVTYGLEEGRDLQAEDLKIFADYSEFTVRRSGAADLTVRVNAYGTHMVYATLAGIASGLQLGLSEEEILRGIEQYRTVGGRANIIRNEKYTVINDCYNANPDSMKNAIDSLVNLPGRKVCILGDMLELGENSEQLHRGVGEYASGKGVELLLTVGELARDISSGADRKKTEGRHYESNEDLIGDLDDLVRPGDNILVKASHAMHFEEIVDALT